MKGGITQVPIILQYLLLTYNYKMEKFVHSDVDKLALSIFVKIRISNSNLNIERGRYIKLPVEKRICPLCIIELIKL
jgi:hypothetical protein